MDFSDRTFMLSSFVTASSIAGGGGSAELSLDKALLQDMLVSRPGDPEQSRSAHVGEGVARSG